MGSIQENLDRPAKWRARYRDPRGRQVSKSLKRIVDAERWLREQEAPLDRGGYVDPRQARVTFDRVASQWLESRGNRRPSTQARDESVVQNQVLPHLADLPVQTIRPSDLQKWLNRLTVDHSPATVRKAWQIASGVLRLAVGDRLISQSPAREVELPADERDEPRFIHAHDILRLADEIADPAMVLLGGFGGLRIGEVLGLQVEDVDFLARTVTVRRTVSDLRGSRWSAHRRPRKAAVRFTCRLW